MNNGKYVSLRKYYFFLFFNFYKFIVFLHSYTQSEEKVATHPKRDKHVGWQKVERVDLHVDLQGTFCNKHQRVKNSKWGQSFLF